MSQPLSAVERAFELARSGNPRNISGVRKQLAAEGFENVRALIDGPALVRQLRRCTLEAARSEEAISPKGPTATSEA